MLPEAAKLAEAADVFLERGAFDAVQARRYLEACRDAGLALRLHGDQFTESGAIPLAIELGARSVDHLEATGPRTGFARSPRARSSAFFCPRARSSSTGRCRPPAPSSTPEPPSRSQPTSTRAAPSCESLPLVCSLAATQLHLSPDEALSACTVNAAHVLGCADRIGRLAPGYRADIVLLGAPDWRYLAYHLGAPIVTRVVLGGELASLSACPRGSSGGACRRSGATSTRPSGSTPRATSSRSRPTRRRRLRANDRSDGKPPAQQKRPQQRPNRATRTPLPPSWRRAARRSLLLGAVIFVLFAILGSKNGKHNYLSALLLAVLYTGLFIPFTYYIDRFSYGRWERKTGGQAKKR